MNISSLNTTAGYSTDKHINSGPFKEQSITYQHSLMESKNLKMINTGTVDLEKHKKNVEQVLKSIEELKPATTVERFVHEGTNQIVYKVKNKETGDLIREIPEEKLLDMAASLMELNGIIIDEKV